MYVAIVCLFHFMNILQFIFPLNPGHLGCFQFGDITNSVALYFLMYILENAFLKGNISKSRTTKVQGLLDSPLRGHAKLLARDSLTDLYSPKGIYVISCGISIKWGWTPFIYSYTHCSSERHSFTLLLMAPDNVNVYWLLGFHLWWVKYVLKSLVRFSQLARGSLYILDTTPLWVVLKNLFPVCGLSFHNVNILTF